MKTIQSYKRPALIAILLSLLLHLLIVLYMALKQSDLLEQVFLQKKNDESVETEQKKHEWVATQARNGNPGAPVFFKDEPREQTIETDTVDKKEEPQSPPATVMENNDKTQTTTVVILPQETMPQKTATTTNKQKKSPPQTTVAKKQLPSLAQLTQGFLNQVKNNSNYAVSILSATKGLPSDEQLKYENYLHKLGACLHTALVTNKPSMSFINPTQPRIVVALVINRDGSLRRLGLTESSGDRRLDQYTLSVIKDASTSFPPIPHYLPDNPFEIGYVISLATREKNNLNISFY
jgi:TonB family protein